MKVNEVPEKIYIHRSKNKKRLCASTANINNDNIEYINKDAFIEKACSWLKENKDKYLYNTGEKVSTSLLVQTR